MKIANSYNPKVSIIIPCYNKGVYIQEALNSVFQQTCVDYEIIIVDDGSTDEYTIKILAELKVGHPDILFIEQKNGHVANARNNGIKASKGEYILPLDADDKIGPEMLERCLREIEKNKKLGFVYTYVKYFGNYSAIWKNQEYNFYDLLLANYIVATNLFPKRIWEEIGGFDENMKNGYEDWEFLIRMGKMGWNGKLIKEPLFCYRREEKSLTNEALKLDKKNIKYIREKHKDIYNEDSLRKIKEEWGSVAETKNIFCKKIEELKLVGAFDINSWISNPSGTFTRIIPSRFKK